MFRDKRIWAILIVAMLMSMALPTPSLMAEPFYEEVPSKNPNFLLEFMEGTDTLSREILGVVSFINATTIHMDEELNTLKLKLDYLIELEEAEMAEGQAPTQVGSASKEVFRDDFFGQGASAIMPWWVVTKSGGASAPVISDSEIILLTDALLNDSMSIDFGAAQFWIKEDEPIFEGVARLPTDTTNILAKFGFGPRSATDYVYFKYDSSIGPNWLAVIHNTGEQVVDTGVAASTDTKVFRIEQNTTSITFYMGDIGGALSQVAEFTSDLPNKAADAGAKVETLTTSTRQFNVDYIEIVGDR